MSTTTVPAVRTVVDNALYAWSNSSQLCMDALPKDFVSDHRMYLDAVAVAAMETELRTVWAEHGYAVQLGTFKELATSDRSIPNTTYWWVWDEAACRLDAHALVDVAGLNEELVGYREVGE